jgi:hypothetical protein
LIRNKDKIEILNKLKEYRFKASKSTNKSIKLPLKLNDNLKLVAKYLRIRDGGICYSRKYIDSYNEDSDKITNLTAVLFDLRPSLTCKKEVLFCSTVLNILFSRIKHNKR